MAPPDAFEWITRLGIPALVAAVVTFVLNRRLESMRGRREINSRTFDSARESVGKFSELTALYWIRDRQITDAEAETRILLAQADLLICVAAAVELIPEGEQEPLQTALDDLLRFGTGGQFQTSDRLADIARSQRIPAAAAQLRSHLLKARRALQARKGH